jgi:hypothetical protein
VAKEEKQYKRASQQPNNIILTSLISQKHKKARELQRLTRERERRIELNQEKGQGGGGSLGKNMLAVSITGNHKWQEISSMSFIVSLIKIIDMLRERW